MAEFQKVMREWVRARKAINENMLSNFPLEMFTDDNIANIEKEVMSWAADNPEPVYPTWEDWLLDIGVIRKGMSWSDLNIPLRKPIPTNIAEKLGLQPKGYMKCCENCAWYEEEWEYCFRTGNHAPKDGYCDHYPEKLPKENN